VASRGKRHAKTEGAIAKLARPAIDLYTRIGRISGATKRKAKATAST
jgi:hypothetical protein